MESSRKSNHDQAVTARSPQPYRKLCAQTRGYIKIMETKFETTIVYWGYRDYIRIVEKKMDTTIVCLGHIGVIPKLCILQLKPYTQNQIILMLKPQPPEPESPELRLPPVPERQEGGRQQRLPCGNWAG